MNTTQTDQADTVVDLSTYLERRAVASNTLMGCFLHFKEARQRGVRIGAAQLSSHPFDKPLPDKFRFETVGFEYIVLEAQTETIVGISDIILLHLMETGEVWFGFYNGEYTSSEPSCQVLPPNRLMVEIAPTESIEAGTAAEAIARYEAIADTARSLVTTR